MTAALVRLVELLQSVTLAVQGSKRICKDFRSCTGRTPQIIGGPVVGAKVDMPISY